MADVLLDPRPPEQAVAARAPSRAMIVVALLLAAVVGAIVMFAGWWAFSDEDQAVTEVRTRTVVVPIDVAGARALDRVKDEATTAAAAGGNTVVSSPGHPGQVTGKTDAKIHADAIRALGNRTGTPADGGAAVKSGTVVKPEPIAAALAQERYYSGAAVGGTASKHEDATAVAVGGTESVRCPGTLIGQCP
jgi:hypothetical protein